MEDKKESKSYELLLQEYLYLTIFFHKYASKQFGIKVAANFNNNIPKIEALNKVTSEVESVMAEIPSLSINNAFKANFKIIDDNATKNGVFESLNE